MAAGIRLYQRTFSMDHGLLSRIIPGGRCRYWPSCSEYGRQAFRRYGLRRGLLLTLWRIGRCNPFSAGGVDPLP
ncbi:MAG: hypothetical protein G01um101431_662 [Parcubacteria group bacterium Gr01-1014_31]|nr:MAG: hypothetical protein G01um101431_662 [Parcubacteria group bacterium Gr01-1014_31]